MMNERLATWEKIGTDVKGNKVEDVLRQANLDFEVEKRPLYADTGYGKILVPGKMATCRVDNGDVLGVVSDNYQICQNTSAFNFIDTVSNDIEFVKCGMTKTGMVYAIGKMPEVTVLNDTFVPYIIFQTSHNGRYTIKTTICPLRIVCKNQFNMSFRNSTNTISIHHSAMMDVKMKQANELLSDVATYMNGFTNTAEELAMLKIGNGMKAQQIIDSFFESTKDITDRQKKTIELNKNALTRAYNAPDNENFKGTAWGLINGFTDYITHKEVKKTKTANESQFMTVSFDNTIIQKFMNHVLQSV